MRPHVLLAALSLLAVPAAAKNWTTPPRPAETVGELARADDRLGTLARVLETAGMADLLETPGRITLWAPSDAAFAALPDGTLEALLLEENREALSDLLRYHVDDRELRTRDLPDAVIRVKTLLEESRICVARAARGMQVTDATGETAQVTERDIRAANGVIHVIDRVLVPAGVPICEGFLG